MLIGNSSLLLDDLIARGVVVSLTPSGLHVKAEIGVVTRELRERIKASKTELVAALKDRTFVPDEREMVEQLRERGWTVVRSEALGGELVIWVADETVETPPRLSGLIRYTRQELAELEEATEDELRAIHAAKRPASKMCSYFCGSETAGACKRCRAGYVAHLGLGGIAPGPTGGRA